MAARKIATSRVDPGIDPASAVGDLMLVRRADVVRVVALLGRVPGGGNAQSALQRHLGGEPSLAEAAETLDRYLAVCVEVVEGLAADQRELINLRADLRALRRVLGTVS